MALADRDRYTERLTEAIAQACAAGFDAAARELERSCFEVAFTTSSELLGEHALAIRRFLEATHPGLPSSIRTKLKTCLTETRCVWPP